MAATPLDVVIVNGVFAWLQAQAHIAFSVVGAIISNRSAPARQVVIYTVVLVVLAIAIPRLVKLVSK